MRIIPVCFFVIGRKGVNVEQAMISLKHIVKTFSEHGSGVHAVRDVSLDILPGEIFGIVGFSGAGKSTLVRCINLLERPTSGQVIVDNVELTRLSSRALNQERKKIGMIFQQFNLFATRTVYQNVAFPLQHTGMSRAAIHQKVMSLLAFVELSEKAEAYPSQLSGGQKQRVAIARALASDPKILLCDETTSALDPQTPTSILKLLKKLNQELGITIVIITHQMQVIKEICQRVALMEAGQVVEQGDVYDIFARPQQPITRNFVNSAGNAGQLEELLQDAHVLDGIEDSARIIKMKFLDSSAGKALVSYVSRTYNVDLSIIHGNVEMIDGRSLGELVVVASGEKTQLDAAIAYVRQCRIEVEVLLDAGSAE